MARAAWDASLQHGGRAGTQLLRAALRSQFVYLREAFTPSLDDDLAVLKQAYGIDGKLHVNYAMTPAWG